MSLRTTAASDLRVILNDSTTGFGYAITVTDPTQTSVDLTGFTSDISALIDPDTGGWLSGRLASVVLNIADLTAAGLGLPRTIDDESSKPWLITFDDINGNSGTFKIRRSFPDRALGIVTCQLEFYS